LIQNAHFYYLIPFMEDFDDWLNDKALIIDFIIQNLNNCKVYLQYVQLTIDNFLSIKFNSFTHSDMCNSFNEIPFNPLKFAGNKQRC
jgi:hypothetical protein